MRHMRKNEGFYRKKCVTSRFLTDLRAPFSVNTAHMAVKSVKCSFWCVPPKPSEESAKALSTSNDQIPWEVLEHFPQTLAAAAALLHSLTLNPLPRGQARSK